MVGCFELCTVSWVCYGAANIGFAYFVIVICIW